jgi:hypothetical protein
MFGGMDVSDAKRLKSLEDENAKLKKLQAVMGLSERQVCAIGDADRKMVRCRSCRPADAGLRARLRELANERRRYGYRRLFILLRREGEPSGSIFVPQCHCPWHLDHEFWPPARSAMGLLSGGGWSLGGFVRLRHSQNLDRKFQAS